MKNRKIVPTIIAIIILIAIIVATVITKQYKSDSNPKTETEIENTFENPYTNIDKNEIAYQNTASIEELKQSSGTTGDTDIYQIENEYDGRKVLAVKPSVKTKVAFAGMIKKEKPTMQEAETIISEEMPQNTGIWINQQSRQTITQMLNNTLQSKYQIDENGYLQIENKDNQNEYDKKLEQAITSNKQYIIDISSTCYIVDQITGEIQPYLFEELDPYQTYYYVEDADRMIIFLTENTYKKLTQKEIVESVINLMK